MRERSFLLTLLLGVAFLSLTVPVHATPTVIITNLQYPSTTTSNQITVSYTIQYYGTSVFNGGITREWISAGILVSPQLTMAAGSPTSSSPNHCERHLPNYNVAICSFWVTASQGSENVAFSLKFTSVGTYSFIPRAAVLSFYSEECPHYDPSGNVCINAEAGDTPFSISVLDEFSFAGLEYALLHLTGLGYTLLIVIAGAVAVLTVALTYHAKKHQKRD